MPELFCRKAQLVGLMLKWELVDDLVERAGSTRFHLAEAIRQFQQLNTNKSLRPRLTTYKQEANPKDVRTIWDS